MKIHTNDVLLCWVKGLEPTFTLAGVRERQQGRVLSEKARQLWLVQFNSVVSRSRYRRNYCRIREIFTHVRHIFHAVTLLAALRKASSPLWTTTPELVLRQKRSYCHPDEVQMREQ